MTREPGAYYERALICENGHVLTKMLQSLPSRSANFCATCGASTISECPSCSTPIRGEHIVPGVITVTSNFSRPAYCPDCGAPMPWTRGAIEAAEELAADDDDLTDEDRETLRKAIPDLLSDSPRTEVAVNRFKRIMAKAGAGTASAFRSILVDVASEAAKKAIWGSR